MIQPGKATDMFEALAEVATAVVGGVSVALSLMTHDEKQEFYAKFSKYFVGPSTEGDPSLCSHCKAHVPEGQAAPHANICPKWKCVKCGVSFATLPYPQLKLFGKNPL